MVCQELATIKEYDIPVIATVFENRTLGMVYQWQNLLYNERYSQTLWEILLTLLNLQKVLVLMLKELQNLEKLKSC